MSITITTVQNLYINLYNQQPSRTKERWWKLDSATEWGWQFVQEMKDKGADDDLIVKKLKECFGNQLLIRKWRLSPSLMTQRFLCPPIKTT